jgi:hypothetical protein
VVRRVPSCTGVSVAGVTMGAWESACSAASVRAGEVARTSGQLLPPTWPPAMATGEASADGARVRGVVGRWQGRRRSGMQSSLAALRTMLTRNGTGPFTPRGKTLSASERRASPRRQIRVTRHFAHQHRHVLLRPRPCEIRLRLDADAALMIVTTGTRLIGWHSMVVITSVSVVSGCTVIAGCDMQYGPCAPTGFARRQHATHNVAVRHDADQWASASTTGTSPQLCCTISRATASQRSVGRTARGVRRHDVGCYPRRSSRPRKHRRA